MISFPRRLSVRGLAGTTLVPRNPRRETFDCRGYAGQRLDPELACKAPSCAPQLELHLGTASQSRQYLRGREERAKIRTLPGKTSPEVWLAVRSPGRKEKRYVISNILGETRLRHFLAMLKLRGFPETHLSIYDFQNAYDELATSLWGELFGHCQAAIFAFNPQVLAKDISDKTGLTQRTHRSEFLEFTALSNKQNASVLIFNLQYAYGTQIKPLLHALLEGSAYLHHVILIGAGGGIDPSLELGDLVCFDRLYAYNRKAPLKIRNCLPPKDFALPVRNLDVVSAQTVFSETTDAVKRWRERNIGAVDLELFHAALALEGFPGVQLGAVLGVSDLPGNPQKALGETLSVTRRKGNRRKALVSSIGDYVVSQLG